MDRTVAIEVNGLGKVYDHTVAVEAVSFKIYTGEVFALLGPNGAGKTTTLRILISLLRPTSGRALVWGHDVTTETDRVRRLIGYVPQERAIDRFLTGREHLELLGNLYHLRPDEIRARSEALLTLMELTQHADRPVKTYSGGMKRKLDLACGLLPDPKVLLLDEPTLGLDVQSRLRIWEHIRHLKERGITVVMTTNYLDEADQLCDRLAIIDGGRIKAIGTPHDLKTGLGGDIVSLTLAAIDMSRVETLASALKGDPAIRSISTRPSGLDIRVESAEKALPVLLEAVNRLGCRLEFVDYHRPRLDDVFIAHTGHPIREDPTLPMAGSSS